VPGSQLAGGYNSKTDRSNQWGEAVGKTLWLKIIEVDRRRNRLILSERAAVDERRRQQKEELLAELKEGEVRTGRVSSLADFGAFVDLGGAEGLVHLSELAWTQISHPREVLKVGDEINVHVLSIDHDRQRIGLSLKRLQPEPWTQVIHNYQIDQVVPAVITKLTNFGAFARIDNVIEGLIHISELAHRPINHPGEVVNEGDHVEVCIISIDPDKRRMGLSLKQVTEPEIEWVDEEGGAEDEQSAVASAEEAGDEETPKSQPNSNVSDEEEETEAVVV
jgi:small subunit ribosomal protein S1